MKHCVDVTLVSMPFYPAFSCNYTIEYLTQICIQSGLRARAIHSHFDLSSALINRGQNELVDALQSVRYLGDLLVLARWYPQDSAMTIEEIKRHAPWDNELTEEVLLDFYSALNELVEETLRQIVESGTKVVALSATHYQLVPSLWLAKCLNDIDPDIRIILGGYLSSPDTCADILDRHEWLDAVVYGEGEDVIVPIFKQLVAGQNIKNVIHGGRTRKLPARPNFEPLLSAKSTSHPDLAKYLAPCFEVSRGCYWDKCDFCNFNAAYGNFRSFGAVEVIDEMERLATQYDVKRFHLLDTSLPPSFARYCRGRGNSNWDVFVEIMVDFSLEDLKALRSFGVQRAQIGIESFSNLHLTAMRKNADVEANLKTLLACADADITPVYGLLVNRPGDLPEHYLDQIDTINRSKHLVPPRYISTCDLRPGSPLFNTRNTWGAEIRFPTSALGKVLPARDHNCELRPSVVDWPRRHNPLLLDALAELTEAVTNWQVAHADRIEA